MRSSSKHSFAPARSGFTLALALTFLCSGCGNTLYVVRANAAARKLSEARADGAEQYATYEYFYALEHLRKAETEAAEADYGDALDLAEAGERYAEQAIVAARAARRRARP